MKQNKLHCWLALLRTPGVGPNRGRDLLAAFADAVDIFAASPASLAAVGLTQASISAIKNPPWDLIKQDVAWLKQTQHYLITIDDDLYPPLLKEIADPPLALFVAGDPNLLNTTQLAVVGSRNPSHTGKENAHSFAKALSCAGLTVTSGLALGIDAASHQGALAACGKTIAVLGTDLTNIYPDNNRALASEIIQQGGALVSEYSLHMP
ncbi:MAG: DNA-processing protein DprA, partial [Gammaproteobacteria bacterium]|nr:DNA-processing protein DprA [Gammaproteobacteria bacterium]